MPRHANPSFKLPTGHKHRKPRACASILCAQKEWCADKDDLFTALKNTVRAWVKRTQCGGGSTGGTADAVAAALVLPAACLDQPITCALSRPMLQVRREDYVPKPTVVNNADYKGRLLLLPGGALMWAAGGAHSSRLRSPHTMLRPFVAGVGGVLHRTHVYGACMARRRRLRPPHSAHLPTCPSRQRQAAQVQPRPGEEC